jgi:hypothetical protein
MARPASSQRLLSAAPALKAARAAGVSVRVDGDDLEWEAETEAPPPPAVLDLLLHHKAEILRLLWPADDGWSAEDWQIFFDERAAVAEFDGGLPRAAAETRAFACCVTEWLNHNPTPSVPGRCLGCGNGERTRRRSGSEKSNGNRKERKRQWQRTKKTCRSSSPGMRPDQASPGSHWLSEPRPLKLQRLSG